MEQRLQPLLGVVVAELLKCGSPLLLSQSRVLETRSVHNQQGAQRVLTGLQSPGGHKYILTLLWYSYVLSSYFWLNYSIFCCFTSSTLFLICFILCLVGSLLSSPWSNPAVKVGKKVFYWHFWLWSCISNILNLVNVNIVNDVVNKIFSRTQYTVYPKRWIRCLEICKYEVAWGV